MTYCQPASSGSRQILPINPTEESSSVGLGGRKVTKQRKCCFIACVKRLFALIKAIVTFPVRIFKRKAKVTKDETSSKIETLPKKTETLPNPAITLPAQPAPVKQLTPEQIAKENELVDRLNSGDEYIQPLYRADITWDEFLDRQGARLNKFSFFSASLKVANRLLAKCPNVKDVSISASNFSEEVINLKPILEKLKSLRDLCLSFDGVFFNKDTPYLAEALKSLKKLQFLQIGDVLQNGGGGLQPIIANLLNIPCLTTLTITNSALSLVEATDLHNKVLALRNLNELRFEKMYINDVQSVEVLFQALETSSLRSLTFSQSEHGDRVVALLMKQPRLLQNLQHLNFSRCKLSRCSADLLVEHFNAMPNLIWLSLKECFSEPLFEEDDDLLDFEEMDELSEKDKELQVAREAEQEILRMITERKADLPSLVNLYL